MNLVLVEPDEVVAGTVVLRDSRARHLREVLHAAPGQEVRIGVVDGPTGSGMVSAVEAASVTIRCAFDSTPPPRPAVDVLLALPRPKVMRRLWAQLAALGVGRIMLTNAERVERNYFDTHVVDPGTYRPLLVEGLQQARDTRLPLVSIHRRFRVLIEDEVDALSDAGRRLVADPGAAASIADAVAGSPDGGRVLLAIGPEGGWNDFERRLLASHRFLAVGMGDRTLRTDTACIALLALVNAALSRR